MAQKKELSLSEKAVNWSKAIGLLIGAFVAAYGAQWVRGEPGADLAYKRLAEKFNELKIEFVEQRGFVNGFLQGMERGEPQVSEKSEPKEVKLSCRNGHILKDDKCVPKITEIFTPTVNLPKAKVVTKPTVKTKLMHPKMLNPYRKPTAVQQSGKTLLPPTLKQLQIQEEAKAE
jgi:hypothetical protein